MAILEKFPQKPTVPGPVRPGCPHSDRTWSGTWPLFLLIHVRLVRPRWWGWCCLTSCSDQTVTGVFHMLWPLWKGWRSGSLYLGGKYNCVKCTNRIYYILKGFFKNVIFSLLTKTSSIFKFFCNSAENWKIKSISVPQDKYKLHTYVANTQAALTLNKVH